MYDPLPQSKPSPTTEDFDDFMSKQKTVTPKPPSVPKSTGAEDFDSFMAKQSSSALKPLSPKKEAVRQNVIGLQREVTKPENQVAPNQSLNLVTGQKATTGSQFTPPVSLDFRGPTEGEKMANRALGTPTTPSPKPRPMRTALPLAPRPSTLERVQNQQAIERRQPETVETDPAQLEQIRRNTGDTLNDQRQQRIRNIQAGASLDPVQRYGNRIAAMVGGASPEETEAAMPQLPWETPVNRVLQSGAKVGGDTVRGLAEAGTMYPGVNTVSKWMGRPIQQTADKYGGMADKAVSRAAEGFFPEKPEDQSMVAKVERGAGSMLPFMAGAALTGGGSAAAGGLGALSNLGQVASERDASGKPVSDGRRAMSDTLAVATGMTEALGIGRILDRVGLKTPLVHRVAQMAEEGGQEYAQDWLNDVNAKLVAAYDPNRSIDPLQRKYLESAAIGAILGGAGEVADVTGGKIRQQVQDHAAARNVANERPTVPTDIRPTVTGATQVTPIPGARPTRNLQPTAATSDFQKHFALKYQNGQFTLDEAIPLEQAPSQNVKALVDVLQGFQTKPDVPPDMAAAAGHMLQQVQARLSPDPTPASPSTPPSGDAPAFPRLPEPENFNARRAKLLGLDAPAEVGINERVQAANQLLASTNAGDQRQGRKMLNQALSDLRKSEGYLTESSLPPGAPKPFTAVRDAIEAKLSSGTLNRKPSNLIESKPAPVSPVDSTESLNNTGQRLIEQTRQKADQAVTEGRFTDAIAELKAHQQALRDAKAAARKSPGLRTQLERQIGQAGNRIGEVRKLARDAARQANAPTKGLVQADPGQNQQLSSEKGLKRAVLGPNRDLSGSPSQPTESAPLLRPEAVQNPSGGIPQMPEQTFSGRLEQGIRKDQAAQQSIKGSTEDLTIGGMLKRRFPEGIRLADKGEARNLGGREGNALVGLVNKNSRVGVDDVAYALHEEGLRLPDGRPFVEDGRVTATEADVLDFLKSSGKQKVGGTKSLERKLATEEADYNQRQELSPNFDDIVADVDGDTGALQRAIDRSNERGHVSQEPGVGLVSMSPYADMVARNQDAVDRLYQSGLASPEGKEIFRNLREFAAKNGIEAKHLHALADDVRNHELEKAQWADKGIDFSTVQSLDEGTARLRDSVLEDGKSLPDVERTALEREVAALDALFDDADATNLLARAAEGDNNAVNEFRQKATEYGIGADTIGDLIQARTTDRSANRAPRQDETRAPQGAGRDSLAVPEREARSATPEEFDLLNRNPATIPNDEMDAHLRALEKLRNDNIRGIVKLAKDDLRELRRALKNTNDERQFRVKQKQLGPKNEPRYVPTMDERRAKWAEEEQPKAREQKDEVPTVADVLSEAKIQFKSGKRGQAGTLYANDMALHVIRAAYEQAHGEQRFFENVNMNKSAAQKIAAALTAEAQNGNWPADMQRSLRRTAREFKHAAQSGETVSIVRTGAERTFSDIKTSRRHELFHDAQEGLGNSKGFLAHHEHGQKIIDSLADIGYAPEDRTVEAAAFVASGEAKRLGLTDEQGKTFLKDYFNDIVANNGREALERFVSLSPKVQSALKETRASNDIQGTTGKVAYGESDIQRSDRSAMESGRLGATKQASGSGTGIPSTVREQKRFSFGSLPSEPQGQIAASGLGGLQDFFNRKPKPKSAQSVPVPSKFNLGDWSQKFYRDAMAAGLDKADRAAYDTAKTPREKTAVLMSAKVDAKREQSIYDIIDKASDAATKNDGSALYDALSDATDMMRRQPTERGFARVKQEAGNALGVPRSLMASADISAPLRQGSLLTLPPSQWGKAAKATVRMFQAFNSEQYKQISKEINLHPDAETARDAGLYISTDKSGLVTKKEEDFLSNWTEKIPLVKQSEQAYKTYLDSLRMDTFARYKKSIDKTKGLSAEQKETAYKAAADWINVATGRGTLGETFESAMPVLSKVMFAPRYTASRIQVLNPMTYAKNARTAEGRAVLKNQMADMVQYAGAISATLALAAANGATVGLDPDDADFLKIKVGNTRYDVLAGLQQPMRLFYRMGKSLYGRATGEKTKGNQSTLDIASRFGRSKLAPVPSFFVDYLSGKDFTGQDFKFNKAVADRVAPLMWKDFYDAYQKEGLAGGLKVLPGITGIGVQNYGEKPNILKSSAFSKAAAEKGMKIETLKMKKDEPEAVFTQRKARVEDWMDEYGQKLLDSPRYKAMTADEQKAAMQLLRARIGRQQNLKQPKPNSFEPNAVLLGVKKSAATKARRQSKYLYSQP